MLTSSPQILQKIQTYRDRNFFYYENKYQTIVLNCDTAGAWSNDDEFFRNIFFGGPDLNSIIDLHLIGKDRDEIAVKLQSRSIPNIVHYLCSLGYNTDVHLEIRAVKSHEEFDRQYAELRAEEISTAVDAEFEVLTDSSTLSTNQTKTKKRK